MDVIQKINEDGYGNPCWFVEHIWWPIEDKLEFISNIRHWFMYHFIPKHKYHLINTGLSKRYHELETRLLYGAFSLLIDYVDREKCFKVIDWDENPDHKRVAAEIRYLYGWWKFVRPDRKDPLDKLPRDRAVFEKGETDEHGNIEMLFPGFDEPETKKIFAESWDWEERCHKEDTDNLMRLIMIRRYLWT